MAITYKAIATTTVGSGGSGTFEFTNIPSTYTDLCLEVSARSLHNDGYETAKIFLNGNPVYRFVRINGYATTGTSNLGTSSNNWWVIGANSSTYATPNTFTSAQFYFPNYTGSAYKSVAYEFAVEQNGNGGLDLNWLGIGSGLATLTSAISSISFSTINTSNFAQHSTATLYGIKNTV